MKSERRHLFLTFFHTICFVSFNGVSVATDTRKESFTEHAGTTGFTSPGCLLGVKFSNQDFPEMSPTF